MTPTAAPATQPAAGSLAPFVRVLGIAGLGCLALITLVSPASTRMFAFPWSLALAVAVATPALMLALRAFDSRQPLILPPRGWGLLAHATAAVILASALVSPHRGASLLWSAPLLASLAVFFLVYDWLHRAPSNRARVVTGLGWTFAAIVVVSLALWLADLPGRSLDSIAGARNPFPLGHSSYTGALALLALPCFVALGLQAARPVSFAWSALVVLALAMLVTSASRGALIGLGPLAVAALIFAPFDRKRKLLLGGSFLLLGLALALAHPRTRAMFQPTDPAAPPNLSNVQRSAMLDAGRRMGADRPLLGWGPGTVPLVYPRYRAALAGGADTVLQLHCTPAQLWAEFGLAGVACAVAFVSLAARGKGRDPTAAAALAGYAVFSLTDWQLDVPIFGFSLAAFAALLAPDPVCHLLNDKFETRFRRFIGGAALVACVVVAALGRRDPTPELNVRALTLGRDVAQAEAAIALLRESLALNPDQELAHFNLGWLLVTRDPPKAENYFRAAAQLVPDKGGVYFGLGLARLNQGRRDQAARAFALECLNDPRFLSSPWWLEPGIAELRDATRTEFTHLGAQAARSLEAGSWPAAQLTRVLASAPTLGAVPPEPPKMFTRQRAGYPVLMRNLDLPPPLDLYVVREATLTAGAPLPAKGWLPSPLLLQLLDARRAD
ncbi:MAG: O-antigen ligase family protein [Verrucomicrobia bacterium]|nr:O-antigen ligase family protein [Verrucomicrobiota bacterium]